MRTQQKRKTKKMMNKSIESAQLRLKSLELRKRADDDEDGGE